MTDRSASSPATDIQVPVNASAGDFITPDDARLLDLIESLRRSVCEKVATGQERGLSLGEIVVQVRDMVRFAEEDPGLPMPVTRQASRAILRQAVSWCVEAYQPGASSHGQQFVADTQAWNPESALKLLAMTPPIVEAPSPEPPIK